MEDGTNRGPALPQQTGSAGVPPSMGYTYGAEAGALTKGISRLDQMRTIFGINKELKNDDYHEYDIENQILPDAYKDTIEKHFAKTIIQRLDSVAVWWVTVCYPWAPFTGTAANFRVVRLNFNTHQLDRVPEQGVPRFVTQNYEEWKMGTERWGIGILMEGGLMLSQAGVAQWALSVQQCTNAIFNTAALAVIYSIIESRGVGSWFEQYGVPPDAQEIRRLFERETAFWNILSDDNGFQRMQFMCEQVLSYRDVKPDYLLLPRGTIRHYQINHNREMDYDVAGAAGPKQRNADGPIPSQSRYKLFEVGRFEMGSRARKVDVLEMKRTIGDAIVFTHQYHMDCPPTEYSSKVMNTTVLNYEAGTGGRLEEVRFSDCLNYLPLFTALGDLSAEVGVPFFTRKANVHGTFGEFIDRTGQSKNFWNSVAEKLDNPNSPVRMNPKLAEIFVVGDATRKKAAHMRKSRGGGASAADGATLKASIQQVLAGVLRELASEPAAADPSSGDDGDCQDGAAWMADFEQNIKAHTAKRKKVLKWIETELGKAGDSFDVRKCPLELHQAFFIFLADAAADNEALVLVTEAMRKNQCAFLPGWYSRALVAAVASGALAPGDRLTLLHAVRDDSENAPAPVDPNFGDVPHPREFTGSDFRDALQGKLKTLTKTASKTFRIKTHEDFANSFHVHSNDLKALMSHSIALAALITDRIPDTIFKTVKHSRAEFMELLRDAFRLEVADIRCEIAKKDMDAADVCNVHQVRIVDAFSAADFWTDLLSNDALFDANVPLAERARSVTTAILTTSPIGKATKVNEDSDEFWKTTLHEFPVSLLTRKFFRFLLEKDVWFPFHAAAFRPYIECSMSTGFLMKVGEETGRVLRGFPHFQVSRDGSRKMVMGNFTMNMGACTLTPNNILPLYNVSFKSYNRGGGCGFWQPFRPDHENAWTMGVAVAQCAFFAVPLYPHERLEGPFLDITGKFPKDMAAGMRNGGALHYEMARECTQVYKWKPVDAANYFDNKFEANGVRNTRCALAHQLHYTVDRNGINPRGVNNVGTGHFPNTYDGCLRAFSGEGQSNYTTLHARDARFPVTSY